MSGTVRTDLDPRPGPFHALPIDAVYSLVGSGAGGLRSADARARLAQHGPNLLRAIKPTPAWKILVQQFRSVVVMLLAAAAVFSFAVGDPLDAVAIAVVLLINTGLGFTTEYRARQAVRALLALEAPHAVVIRDDSAIQVEAREIVPGDVIELEAGNAVPADARVIKAEDLRVNEAPLTGESAPSIKMMEVLPRDVTLPDRANMVYAGTLVAAGGGRAVVVSTGSRTEIGRIGEIVGAIESEPTPLEERLDALGKRLAWIALLAGAVVAALGLLQDVPVEIVVQTAIALAIAAVPEGLPAVATIALAVGVRRMARRNALVRRLPSVETLGAVGVICSDKTGTLTAGEITATTFWLNGLDVRASGTGYADAGEFTLAGRDLDASEAALLKDALLVGLLANRAALDEHDGEVRPRGDPTEVALLVAARKAGLDRDAVLGDRPEVAHVPFSSDRMWMATFHAGREGTIEARLKGAPDRIIALCTRVATADGEERLDDGWRKRILSENQRLAERGLRVLGLVRGVVTDAAEAALHDLVFVGLAAMIDPPAEGVKETIETLHGAGIRTIMITGDQSPTALAVARDLGIAGAEEGGLDGRQLEEVGEAEARERIPATRVFSRVSPEQKLDIITVLQESGEVVAMLGDGVNDAAALRKADIGVAMGRRGTDVAKEVAGVVLRDDRFATIVAAVEQGRIIYDNIRKFVFYLFSCNLAEVLLLVGAGLAGLPVPLTPLQILWLNIVTDTFPALALAFEPAEADVMRRPPRDPSAAILSRGFLRAVVFYGLLMALTAGAALAAGLAVSESGRAGTIAFMTLALAQAFHLGNARSTEHVMTSARAFNNRYATAALAIVIALQLAAVYLPPLARILGTVPLNLRDWSIIVPLALATAIIGQAIEVYRARRQR